MHSVRTEYEQFSAGTFERKRAAGDPSMLGFLLEGKAQEGWAFRRHPTLTLSLARFGTTTSDGVPCVRPEISLLYKAKAPRFKDVRDLEVTAAPPRQA
jgi:hypothetical protein